MHLAVAAKQASEAVVAALLALYPEAAKAKDIVRPQRPCRVHATLAWVHPLTSPAAALRRLRVCRYTGH